MRKGLAWPWGWGGVANMILHNMFVAIQRGADGALWQWKEAGRVGRRGARRSQTGGGPGRRTREGSAHCSPLRCNRFLFVLAARPSLPPSQLRGEAWPPGNECFGYSLAQKPRGKCKQSADGMPPSKFPYLVLAAAAER